MKRRDFITLQRCSDGVAARSAIQMTADIYGHLFPTGDDGAELAAAEKLLLA